MPHLTSAVVHLIDDDDAVREALAFSLSAAGLAVRVYHSAGAFVAALETVQAGCIVTDVRMPGMSGIELLRELRTRRLDMPAIVMTGHGDIGLAVDAMKSGAADFIEKPVDDDSLLESILSALDRHNQHEERRLQQRAAQERLAVLSDREKQILNGLVAGHANKAIARDLGLSPRTVEVHRANVMAKTGSKSLSDLVRLALAADQED